MELKAQIPHHRSVESLCARARSRTSAKAAERSHRCDGSRGLARVAHVACLTAFNSIRDLVPHRTIDRRVLTCVVSAAFDTRPRARPGAVTAKDSRAFDSVPDLVRPDVSASCSTSPRNADTALQPNTSSPGHHVMPRIPRHASPGSRHHIMDRGIARRPIFENQTDRQRYLELLAGQVDAGRLIVHSFALMENHLHLFVESPNGDLSTPMREIKREYSRRYNRVLERDGALFRSRFYSKVVEDEEYRRAVLEYIDLNAVKAGLVAHPCDYDHSSAAWFARGRELVPTWLCTDWVSAVVEERVGVAGLPPGAYRSLYVVTDDPTSVELVEARLRVGAILDPRARWSRADAEQRERFIADWLRQRAELADGPGDWLPLTSAQRVIETIEGARKFRGPWTRVGKGPTLDLWGVLVVGLLRHVAGLSVADCVRTLGLPLGVVRGRAARHLDLLRSDAEYLQRMVDVTGLVTSSRRQVRPALHVPYSRAPRRSTGSPRSCAARRGSCSSLTQRTLPASDQATATRPLTSRA